MVQTVKHIRNDPPMEIKPLRHYNTAFQLYTISALEDRLLFFFHHAQPLPSAHQLPKLTTPL
jgi:hypothetical protein